ncbi:MAG: hypothetical protein JXA97_06300 [Anaerolineales bacterium]|nr:hypothetical protein [Anaerolineales bacterium]
MLKVALLAPTGRSMYSRLLAQFICREPMLSLELITVRRMLSLNRIRGELRRDGPRLLRKVAHKLVLGEERLAQDDPETLAAYAKDENLSARTLKSMARKQAVPFLMVTDLNHPEAERALREVEPDVVVFSGGGLIRDNILSIPKQGILNCHAGILPPYRGMDVVEWALLETGKTPPLIGLTCHFMDKGVDTGPILKTHLLDLQIGDTIAEIRNRLQPAMVNLMMETLRDLERGQLTTQDQLSSDGRQYFVMHPRIKLIAAKKLAAMTAPIGR